jgi:hypothetical protein
LGEEREKHSAEKQEWPLSQQIERKKIAEGHKSQETENHQNLFSIVFLFVVASTVRFLQPQPTLFLLSKDANERLYEAEISISNPTAKLSRALDKRPR